MKTTYTYSATLTSMVEVNQDENTGFINVTLTDLAGDTNEFKIGNKYLIEVIRVFFSKAGYEIIGDELLTQQWTKHFITLVKKFNETKELNILMDCYKGYTKGFIKCLAEGNRDTVQEILEILLEVK
ncbi:hypothetical protein H3019_gp27 [Bacillus phage Karezi]|uniref:Uncharacterized protein n=1 Tax=Bacillus phage Karezi TaxID=2591398 RepID=A0A514AAP9_9CAUD|nr:hypothetical protein H3019_gp27 [Bacillus phage Karezi]QDH50348.1 hypothetical protein KAREZI_27 [Bacillus phage Karezi]